MIFRACVRQSQTSPSHETSFLKCTHVYCCALYMYVYMYVCMYVCMYVSACDVMIDKIDRRERELAAFLAERSIDWTLPNQSPVMVAACSSAEWTSYQQVCDRDSQQHNCRLKACSTPALRLRRSSASDIVAAMGELCKVLQRGGGSSSAKEGAHHTKADKRPSNGTKLYRVCNLLLHWKNYNTNPCKLWKGWFRAGREPSPACIFWVRFYQQHGEQLQRQHIRASLETFLVHFNILIHVHGPILWSRRRSYIVLS